uniref:hypothetical protein n=1 Tax=Squamanita imbachii TaxID=2976389 RepID=UPI0030E5E8CD
MSLNFFLVILTNLGKNRYLETLIYSLIIEIKIKNKFNLLNSSKNILFSRNFIHTTAILFSEVIKIEVLNRTFDETIRLGNERISNLELIKYKKEIVEEDLNEIKLKSYKESSTWFLDDEGNVIDYNKTIVLFHGVKLISNFLEKWYERDNNLISEVKLSELLKPF